METIHYLLLALAGLAAGFIDAIAGGGGLITVPALLAETGFPFGLFRAWTVWRPATEVLVYPRPETPPQPLPAPVRSDGKPPPSPASLPQDLRDDLKLTARIGQAKSKFTNPIQDRKSTRLNSSH